VTPNGTAGINFEHAWGDGYPISILLTEVCLCIYGMRMRCSRTNHDGAAVRVWVVMVAADLAAQRTAALGR